LKHLARWPSARSPQEPPPSSETLWSGHVLGPAARFRIDSSGNEFVIEREALSTELRKQLDDFGAGMRFELHQVVTDWSNPRHAQVGLIADLPYRWRSFNVIALGLVERGQGHCLCRTCQHIFPADELKVTRSRSGYEYVTLSTQALCPAGHILMQSEAHFRVRVPRADRFPRVEAPPSPKRG
jgi:hypothetical protein